MTKIMMNPADVNTIADIITENNITGNFELDHNNTSGIGYTIDLTYTTELNGRDVKITVPVCGVENW